MKLKIPAKIGDVILKIALARWSRTFSGLVHSGVPILQAIEITGTTAGNYHLEKAMADVKESVQRGGTIGEPLKKSEYFPSMVAHMVGVGEETGNLDGMLGKVADFYEDEVAAVIKALTSILEPVMIIVVGAMVGFIVISMYLPLFQVLRQHPLSRGSNLRAETVEPRVKILEVERLELAEAEFSRRSRCGSPAPRFSGLEVRGSVQALKCLLRGSTFVQDAMSLWELQPAARARWRAGSIPVLRTHQCAAAAGRVRVVVRAQLGAGDEARG